MNRYQHNQRHIHVHSTTSHRVSHTLLRKIAFNRAVFPPESLTSRPTEAFGWASNLFTMCMYGRSLRWESHAFASAVWLYPAIKRGLPGPIPSISAVLPPHKQMTHPHIISSIYPSLLSISSHWAFLSLTVNAVDVSPCLQQHIHQSLIPTPNHTVQWPTLSAIHGSIRVGP